MELGLYLGYNWQKEALVIEAFQASETFKSSWLAAGLGGLNWKAGVYIKSRDIEGGTSIEDANSFYPPALPLFASQSKDTFVTGGSTSFPSWPPIGLADLQTYSNSRHENPLLTLMISPLFKGFPVLRLGNLAQSVRLIVYQVTDFIRWFGQVIQSRSSPSPMCRGIL